MARFGGSLMRGLAGMLGGVSEGIDEQQRRKLQDAELALRQQAEARALAQDAAADGAKRSTLAGTPPRSAGAIRGRRAASGAGARLRTASG